MEARFELAAKEQGISAVVTYRWNAKEPVLRKFVQDHECRRQGNSAAERPLGNLSDRRQAGRPRAGFSGLSQRRILHELGASGRLGHGARTEGESAAISRDEARAGRDVRVHGDRLWRRRRRAKRERRSSPTSAAACAAWSADTTSPTRSSTISAPGRREPSGNWLNSDEFELHSLRLLAESQKATGCRFDFCNIHFWVDPAGDMKRWNPQRFPQGIANIKPILDTLGTAPGLWIDSSNTWGGGWAHRAESDDAAFAQPRSELVLPGERADQVDVSRRHSSITFAKRACAN